MIVKSFYFHRLFWPFYFELYYGPLNSILSLITYNLHIRECARGVFNMISHDNLTCANTESKIVMPYN